MKSSRFFVSGICPIFLLGTSLCALFFGALCCIFPTSLHAAPPPGVLIQEVFLGAEFLGVGGGFVELINTSDEAISLEGFFLSNSPNAYLIVAESPPVLEGGFIAKFPVEVLEPNVRWVLSFGTSDEFFAIYGYRPDRSLESSGDGDEFAISPAFVGAFVSGEWRRESGMLWLFYWDGEDLVQDADYLRWGSDGPALDRHGVLVDGPDPDIEPSRYLWDTPREEQSPVGALGQYALVRLSALEAGEPQDGRGEGLGGHNETAEPWDKTFSRSTLATPGLPDQITGDLRGRVLDGGGAALGGALLRVRERGIAIETDAQGAFLIEDILVGDLTLEASVPGLKSTVTFLELTPDGQSVDLILSSGRWVRGRVTLEGLESPLLRETLVGVPSLSLQTSTDADGDFELGPLPRGLRDLYLQHSGYRAQTLTFSGDLSQESFRFDVHLYPDVGVQLQVEIGEGMFPGGTSLSLVEVGASEHSFVTSLTEPSARLVLNDVPAGEYQLSLRAPGRGAQIEKIILLTDETIIRSIDEALNPAPEIVEWRCQIEQNFLNDGSASGQKNNLLLLILVFVGVFTMKKRKLISKK